MNDNQKKLICNGIASLCDALDERVDDVIEALTDASILSEEDAGDILEYWRTL